MNEQPIDVSLVVATASRAHLLRRSLGSLFAQRGVDGLRLEMVVVDDGSADNTADVLAELAREAPFELRMLAGTKRGVAAARNMGAAAARGTWLATFDDDQVAAEDWLAKLVALAVTRNAVCVGGSMWLQMPEGVALAEFGPRARRLLGEVSAEGEARPYASDDTPATNNSLVRRDVFVALGGFDERFTEGGEDTDFFTRMRDAGHALWFEPAARVEHLIPASRVSGEALCLTAMRIGVGRARVNQVRSGWRGPLKLAVLRAAAAGLRDLPTIWFSRDAVKVRDARYSLCFTRGLLKAIGSLRGGDAAFLESMDFRKRHGERDDATER